MLLTSSSLPPTLPTQLDLPSIRAALQRSTAEGRVGEPGREEEGGEGGGRCCPAPQPPAPTSPLSSTSLCRPPPPLPARAAAILPCTSPLLSSKRDKSTLVLSLTKRLRSMKQLLQTQPRQHAPHTVSPDCSQATVSPPPAAREEEDGVDNVDDDAEADKENAAGPTAPAAAPPASQRRLPAKGMKGADQRPIDEQGRQATPRRVGRDEAAAAPVAFPPCPASCPSCAMHAASLARLEEELSCASSLLLAERESARLEVERLQRRYAAVIQEKDEQLDDMRRLIEQQLCQLQQPPQRRANTRKQPQPPLLDALYGREGEAASAAQQAEPTPPSSPVALGCGFGVPPSSPPAPPTASCASPVGLVPAYPTLTPSSSPLLSPAQLSARLNDTEELITFHAAHTQSSSSSSSSSAHSSHTTAVIHSRAVQTPLPPTPPASACRSPPPSLPLPLPPRSPYPHSFSPGRPPSARRQLRALQSTPPAATGSPRPFSSSAASPMVVAWQAYLERKGLQRERELQAIPITSPSTPDSKRRKILTATQPHSTPQRSAPQHQQTPLHTPKAGSTLTASTTPTAQPSLLSHSSLSAPPSAVALTSSSASDAVNLPIAPTQLRFDDDGDASRSPTTANDAVAQAAAEAAAAALARLPPASLVVASAQHRRAETAGGRLELRGGCLVEDEGGVRLRRASSGLLLDHAAASGAAVSVAVAAGVSGLSVSAVSGADGRRLSAELRRLRAALDLKVEWAVRVKALNGVEELSREEAGLLCRWPDWARELEQLRVSMAEQLTDLRSSIVREACRTLIALCEANRVAFDREVDFYFPLLYRGLYVTIRVIRDSCSDCLQAIVQRMQSSRTLLALMQGCNDPHAVVRAQCGTFITSCLTAQAAAAAAGGSSAASSSGSSASPAASSAEVEAAVSELSGLIARHLQDSDHSTRAAFRQLHRAFNSTHPHHAQTSAHARSHSVAPRRMSLCSS